MICTTKSAGKNFKKEIKNIQHTDANFEYNTTSKRKKTNKGNKEVEDAEVIEIPEAPLPTYTTSEGKYFMRLSLFLHHLI